MSHWAVFDKGKNGGEENVSIERTNDRICPGKAKRPTSGARGFRQFAEIEKLPASR
ncbi:hypothetical protein H9X84_12060 [Anaerotignum lactatifermentans]|nr:hypothetical protein [Anaerotignum lactatifermentans]